MDKFHLSFLHRRYVYEWTTIYPEFKEEAIKQVLDRGYTTADVAARLGVS
jgi:transposase-like protein